jgi:CRP-like cAMP-binding protein
VEAPKSSLPIRPGDNIISGTTVASASATPLFHYIRLKGAVRRPQSHRVTATICVLCSWMNVALMKQQPAGTAASSVNASAPVRSRLLDGLTLSDRDSVLAAASTRCLKAHSVPVHQGDAAEYLFLICKGQARHFYITPQGRKILLLWLTEGQLFGGSALLSTPTEYLVGTEILRDSCLLCWPRRTIRALAGRIPRLLDNALSVAMEYLTWYLAAHTSLVSDSAEQRLAQVVVTFAKGFGRKTADGTCVELTNEQLANAANVTPFTASRILSSWQRTGAIAKTRGRLMLRSPERLFSVAP